MAIKISLTKGFLPPDEAEQIFDECLEQIPFEDMYWGNGILKRKVYEYDYSSNYLKRAFNHECEKIPVLDDLINRISEHINETIVSAVCNYYRDGSDYSPSHQDDSGFDLCILSLGGTREVVLTSLTDNSVSKYTLSNGDLFFFNQVANATYKHSIPKKNNAEPRISLVFHIAPPLEFDI